MNEHFILWVLFFPTIIFHETLAHRCPLTKLHPHISSENTSLLFSQAFNESLHPEYPANYLHSSLQSLVKEVEVGTRFTWKPPWSRAFLCFVWSGEVRDFLWVACSTRCCHCIYHRAPLPDGQWQEMRQFISPSAVFDILFSSVATASHWPGTETGVKDKETGQSHIEGWRSSPLN